MGAARTFVTERPGGKVDVDDAFEAVVEFEGGAVGTIEATRFASAARTLWPGRSTAPRARSPSTWSA